MANTVDVRYIVDNSRRTVAHVYILSDGVAGELTDEVVVDVSALTPTPSKVSINKIKGVFSGTTGVLEWDATADVGIFSIPDSETFEFNFGEYGGLTNNAGAGVTGDITLSTTGFATAGDTGFLIIECLK